MGQEGWGDRLNKIIISKSKTFLAFCFCFLAGVGAASFIEPGKKWTLGLYVLLYVLAGVLMLVWSRREMRFVMAALFFMVFGIWRYGAALPDCTRASELCRYGGQKVSVAGWVDRDPDRRIDRATYTVRTQEIIVGRERKQVRGRLSFSTTLYPLYQYGDYVRVECKLRPPEIEPGKQNGWLKSQRITGSCSFPQIQVVGDRRGYAAVRWLYQFKELVARRIDELWIEPESSLLAGILYGERGGLPKRVTENFSRTGLSHIMAVSGSNITIIATNLLAMCIALGLYRRQAIVVTLGVVWLFVFFTGASASVVRAGIMGSLLLIAQYLGRLSQAGRLVVCAAVVMALVNPMVVRWDIGFQLSFVATLGLIYIYPRLERWVEASDRLCAARGKISSFMPRGVVDFFIETLLATLAAIIATIPISIYYFGTLSIVAPLTNVLVAGIIPWLMAGGMAGVAASLVPLPLDTMVAGITALGLKYVLAVVAWFGGRSWATADMALPWWMLPIMYSALWWVFGRKGS